uniref:Uncharacterized protein n=1 Tax=Arundo donax TaxID=35708 RepID=A0A0A9JDS2_ARUDO
MSTALAPNHLCSALLLLPNPMGVARRMEPPPSAAVYYRSSNLLLLKHQ